MKINYLAVVVAAAAAFVFSSLYYSPLLLGNLWRAVDSAASAGGRPSMAKTVGEIVQTLMITPPAPTGPAAERVRPSSGTTIVRA